MQRSALYVRLASTVAEDLDQHVRSDGRSKQAVVEDLIATQLRGSSNERTPDHGTMSNDIINVDDAAAWLDVTPEAVLSRIADGDLPARRFGSEWRISRTAVTAWMHGTDPFADHQTGFG